MSFMCYKPAQGGGGGRTGGGAGGRGARGTPNPHTRSAYGGRPAGR